MVSHSPSHGTTLLANNLPGVAKSNPRNVQLVLHRLRLGYQCNWEIDKPNPMDCIVCNRSTDKPLVHYVLECVASHSHIGPYMDAQDPEALMTAAARVKHSKTLML